MPDFSQFKNAFNQQIILADPEASIASLKKMVAENPKGLFVFHQPNNAVFLLENAQNLAELLEEWQNKKKIKSFILSAGAKLRIPKALKPDDFIQAASGENLILGHDNQVLGVLDELPELSGISGKTVKEILNITGNETGFSIKGGSRGIPVMPVQEPQQSGDEPPPVAEPNIPESPAPPTAGKPWFLNAECSDSVETGQLLQVEVLLARMAGKQGSGPLKLNIGETIEILAVPAKGFTLEGEPAGTVQVTDEEKGKPLPFRFRAQDVGTGQIIIYARYQGRQLAVINLDIQVTAETVRDAGRTQQHSENFVPVKGVEPDLTFLVHETMVNGKVLLSYNLFSPNKTFKLNYTAFSMQLETDPANFFLSLFSDIDNLKLDNREQRKAAQSKLESRGAELYESLFPPEMRRLFWRIKDRVKTMIVNSQEPWIPWEMVYMQPEDPAEPGGGFFCELFDVSRWIAGLALPEPVVNLQEAALVVPQDSELSFAPKEKADLTRLLTTANAKVAAIKATYTQLEESFSLGKYSLWHFSGHGTANDATNPGKFHMVLEGEDEFGPEDINRKLRNLGKARPVIFFNACQIGRSGMGLTGIGGWPKKFLEYEAVAFIGSYWSVVDESAYRFALKFYELLLNGETIAAAFRQSRLHIKDAGDPTWLSYTLYADPFAQIEKTN